jgi:XTP/dITP diphosphohydrolase
MKDRIFVLASGNEGKLGEIRQVLSAKAIEIRPQSDWDAPEVDETGLTFVENAILKARSAAAISGLPAIADDSGLEVEALDGAPGVRSARFAGDDSDDEANNRLLLESLQHMGKEGRRARFRCVMVCLRHPEDPAPIICEATWEGRIARTPRGDNGFGYDPLFIPDGHSRTAAELPSKEKNRLSHRGKALARLATILIGDPVGE